jgi:hypothetical protein
MTRRYFVALALVTFTAATAYWVEGNPSSSSKQAPPSVVGDWTGEWGPFNPAKGTQVDKEKCKTLDCKVVFENGVWRATFEGECGRPYKYTITMEGRQSGDAVLFKGSADLGEQDGGVYDWVGRARGDEFIGFYTSAHTTGVFHLSPGK